MNRFYRFCMIAVASAAIAACGEGPGADLELPNTGSLSIQMKGLEDAPVGVERVDVRLWDSGDFDVTVSSNSAPWEVVIQDLRFGPYSVMATAFDADEEIIFQSEETSVEVKRGIESMMVVLYQTDTEILSNTPRITSIVFDKAEVRVEEDLEITVNTTGGVGSLNLGGKFWTGACTDPSQRGELPTGTAACLSPEADSFGSFGTATGTTITWTAPKYLPTEDDSLAPSQHGDQAWFVLVIEDGAGNSTELGVDVPLFNTIENYAVQTSFFMAPVIEASSRVVNDADAAYFVLNYLVTADEGNASDELAYELTSGCDYTHKGGVTDAAGTIDSGQSLRFYLEVDNDHRNGDCEFTFKATDAQGLSSTHSQSLSTEFILPSSSNP